MADAAPPKVYHYNAHSHGLSARFERPVEHLIDVQAASSLPTTGGYGSSRVNDFQFEEFVSFKTAYSYVSGSKAEDGTYTTLATAVVEALNILDVVTADRIVARLATQHPAAEDESQVVAVGSQFENLRIAGCPVEVELNQELFLRLSTFGAIRKELASTSDFSKMTEDPFQTGQKQKVPPDPQGVLLCSLVKDMKTTCPGVKRQGHAFIVPQFGKVFVAEMLAWRGTRTLTMLRLEMGSPVCGTVVVAEISINGHPWPP
jgi:hypothetical protein